MQDTIHAFWQNREVTCYIILARSRGKLVPNWSAPIFRPHIWDLCFLVFEENLFHLFREFFRKLNLRFQKICFQSRIREAGVFKFLTFEERFLRFLRFRDGSVWTVGLINPLNNIGNEISRTLRKTRRQRQRERHKTKGLMSKTIDVHVRYNSWYISLPSSAKQQREMTKFSVVWRTWPQPLIFPISVWNWTHSWHTQQGKF